ncbi:MAG: homocysteine S-methyltransferase [bacterium]|nr:homocysteine S-methyltransferase [bacterium]
MKTLLNRQLPLVLDGALATELEHRGADLSGGLWSARILQEQPELIRSVHLDYFRAGADVAITASYQAARTGFLKAGYTEEQAKELVQRSVGLAQEARTAYLDETGLPEGRAPLIAGSVGPYGAYLADGSEYRGHYGLSDEALRDFHLPRIEWLLAAAPDLLAFETLPSLQEAQVLLRLLETFPDVHAWFSFTAKDTAHISEGQPLSAVGQLLGAHPQVLALGFNCIPPHLGTALLSNIKQYTSKPLIIYPNSGEGWDAQRQCWLPAYRAPQGFGALPEAWLAAGAGLIGGCCRTRPEDIRVLREKLLPVSPEEN